MTKKGRKGAKGKWSCANHVSLPSAILLTAEPGALAPPLLGVRDLSSGSAVCGPEEAEPEREPWLALRRDPGRELMARCSATSRDLSALFRSIAYSPASFRPMSLQTLLIS